MNKFDEAIEVLDVEIDKIQSAISNEMPIPNSLDKLQELRFKLTELKNEYNN